MGKVGGEGGVTHRQNLWARSGEGRGKTLGKASNPELRRVYSGLCIDSYRKSLWVWSKLGLTLNGVGCLTATVEGGRGQLIRYLFPSV